MPDIIGKIAVLLGVDRGFRGNGKRKKRPGTARPAGDTVTISGEARRLLDRDGGQGPLDEPLRE